MNTEIHPSAQTRNAASHAPSSAASPEPRSVRVEPAVDVVDVGEAVLLVADLPGVRAGDLTLQVQGGVLTLEGLQAAPPPGAPYERKLYTRRFKLADALDGEAIEARLEAGILTLRIGKTASALPRTIPITVG
jgi:HSP20 family protein